MVNAVSCPRCEVELRCDPDNVRPFLAACELLPSAQLREWDICTKYDSSYEVNWNWLELIFAPIAHDHNLFIINCRID